MRPQVRYSFYPPTKRGVHFSREELLNIGMAVGALTLAFSLLYIQPLAPTRNQYSAQAIVIILAFSFIAVITGFLLHEMAHKIMAVKYGLWAEFRASTRGLLFAVVTALVGIVLAAPGAVYISGPVDTRRNGKISVAGPLTNLGFGGVAVALYFAVTRLMSDPSGILIFLLIQVANVNLILGTFNMIPVYPIDGSKVWRWNKPLWFVLIAIFIMLLVLFFLFLWTVS